MKSPRTNTNNQQHQTTIHTKIYKMKTKMSIWTTSNLINRLKWKRSKRSKCWTGNQKRWMRNILNRNINKRRSNTSNLHSRTTNKSSIQILLRSNLASSRNSILVMSSIIHRVGAQRSNLPRRVQEMLWRKFLMRSFLWISRVKGRSKWDRGWVLSQDSLSSSSSNKIWNTIKRMLILTHKQSKIPISRSLMTRSPR